MSTRGTRKSRKTAKEPAENLKYVRFDGLRKAAEFSLQETVSKFDIEKLVECYPGVDRETLTDFHHQITEMWTSKALDEFQGIYLEKDLEQKLNELDEIIFESRQRQLRNDPPFLIHRLSAEDIVQTKLLDVKQQSISKLSDKLELLRQENNALMSQVKQMHDESAQNFQAMEQSISHLEELDRMKDQLSDERFKQLLKYITEKCF
ncbi:hypothetical protein KL930_003812 [Ogataea haglerorum]|uniref:Uncharacterized protein n=1 Tax=Ogataea haglerorum TaxID=1937702 RepID=A0AAN6D3M2_9ASCO|nr:hypothetical protein KL915_003460 [Ogataea haglerorum]KAG7695307.1 hypothetical protein KL951_003749 [Ogataea haglerorum]KAG7705171.1 hypothetical protein KL914_003857 [Ogataea haglerorum]KAG7705428.1 hypothetical protein KL950_003864 [Ogataea haglerorum]KAG7716703.1 hypothetical protein KL913_003219 [Ogataea haglerorum]